MARFISNEIMLDILSEVQKQQIILLDAGFCAHLDANIHENTSWDVDPGGSHISFELIVFDGDQIDKRYEFDPRETEEQVRAWLALLIADVNAL